MTPQRKGKEMQKQRDEEQQKGIRQSSGPITSKGGGARQGGYALEQAVRVVDFRWCNSRLAHRQPLLTQYKAKPKTQAEAPTGLEDHDKPYFYQRQPDTELPRTEKEQQC